jgi:hypothetical protein
VPFAVFLVATGAAARLTRNLPGWAAGSAIVLGLVLALSVPFAGYGITDLLGLIGLVWVLAVSLTLLRRPLPVPPGA